MIDFFEIPQAIARRMQDANTRVLQRLGKDIARIGSLNNYRDAQLIAVKMTGESVEEITRELSKASGMTESDIEKLYDDAARYDYEFAEQFYLDRKQVPYKENKTLQRTVKAMTRAAQDDCYNLSHSYAFALRDRDGRVRYTSLAAGYKEAIDKAVTAVKLGTTDYKAEMRRILKHYADSGVRVIDWESGYSQRIDTAVRRNIMDGLRQVKNETQKLIGQEFGADGYEISAHANPAPDHADIQGRQYSFADFEALNESLGRKIGTLNCYHTLRAIILGISRPVYSEEELQAFKRKSNELIDIDGKKYTRYECTQLQRKIETKIRKLKDRKELLKAAGDDVGVRECNRKIRLLKDKYNEVTQKAGLDAHYDRTSVTKSGKTVDSDPLYDIIKREKFSAYERIESGELPLTLNNGNQNKHIQSSHSYKPEDKKSILYGDLKTAQKLVDKYHGKGKLKFTSNGKWTNKEFVAADSDIGIVFDPETGEAKTTNRFAIHYGKKGTHVVPIKREDKK
ncbi:MAG: hypothetical protein IJD78_04280 [Clostridia bacterium]|nr:hypothetical protein [Clostridia bacterium]